MSYDNTNRGQIWPNADKASDRHPDFKGSINVEGKEYWLSAWKRKEGANPKAPSLSFSIQPKEPQNRTNQTQREVRDDDGPGASTPVDDGFDSIPFAPVDWRAS